MDDRGKCFLRQKLARTIIFLVQGVRKNEEEVSGVEETFARKGKRNGNGLADWYQGGVAGGWREHYEYSRKYLWIIPWQQS